MKNKIESEERFFSLELKSKANLKTVTLSNGSDEGVLVEGTIGELVQALFAEGVILEIVGKEGTLRINLKREELKKEPRNVAASEEKGQLKKDAGEVK